MSLETFQSANFQVQFENTEFSADELTVVRPRAQNILPGFENDYAVMCNWFGIAVGEGLGSDNRVVVTLTKNIRGASNSGYSKNHPRMTANANIGGTDDSVLSLFVAEMSEILMSYKGKWNAGDSGGEGLSRVAAELLHPNSEPPGGGNVNAWLAFDPTIDATSAVADTEFRKNWVSENFKGGNLKAGGFVPGDQDSYSFGCSILFIFYLKDQLGFSMPQIVQNGGDTLAETYQNLTGRGDEPFAPFKLLIAANFPKGVQSPSNNPFPLPPVIPLKVAFQANTTNLWSVGFDNPGDLQLGMMAGTSPSIARLTTGEYVIAFQANTGNLWTVGGDNRGDWGLGMKAGTSPAITALPNGGYEVAFQANTSNLWTVGTDFHGDWGLGMMAGTSPCIAALVDGGYEVAFQANTSNLWTVGKDFHGDWQLGMMAGTSPSITGLAEGGYEVAFQANTSNLWTVGRDFHGDWQLGMMRATSPAIAALPGGGYEVAFQANTSNLWTVGKDFHGDWGLGMMAGTSPAIAAVEGGYEVAFQANTSNLWTVGIVNKGDWQLGMGAGTSPCIAR